MATELNFTARLDTSQFLSQIDQARTQFNLAFGGGGGVAGGIGQQFQQMVSGLSASPQISGFGQTFTNPAIAYSPFFGAVQATSQLDQEWAVHRHGYTAAMMMKPPGVSAATYAMGLEGNFADRQIDARHDAISAGRSTLYAGIGGMLGGELAGAVGGMVGSQVGGMLAGRMLGPGAVGAGKMIGGLAGSWFAFDAGMDFVGGKIEKHFAKAEQIGGYTRELGELAGSGMGLKRTERYQLGMSARDAAGDLKMDVQEMGEILALGRQAGMLPNATDPNKAREQYREFAKAIEEGAQILGTSLSGATQVIKAATSNGMGAREGILRAAGAGGPEAFAAQLAQNSFVSQAYQGMANGPIGNMQLMAAMGGGSLNMSLYDLPGAAMGGMSANGGDFMSNMGSFMVHRDQYMKALGPGGARTMARAQLSAGADMIQSFMPDMSTGDAKALFLMSQGFDPASARLVARGGNGNIGNNTSGDLMRQAVAAQNSMLGVTPAGQASPHAGVQFGETMSWGMMGYMAAGPWGAAGGAALGFAHENWGNIKSIGSDLFSGDIFKSSKELADRDQMRMAADYENRMSEARRRYGVLDVDVDAGRRFLDTNLSGARLYAGSGGVAAMGMTSRSLEAAGITPVAPGAGTIQLGNDSYAIDDIKAVSRLDAWNHNKPLGRKENDSLLSLATAAAYGSDRDTTRISDLGANAIDSWTSGVDTWRHMRHLVEIAPSDTPEHKKRKAELLGVVDSMMSGKGAHADIRAVQQYAKYVTNSSTFEADPRGIAAIRARMLGAFGMKETEGATSSREVAWLNDAYQGTVNGAAVPMGQTFWMDVVKHPDYIAASDMAAGPQQTAKVNRAIQEVRTQHGELRRIDAPVVDPNNPVVAMPGREEYVRNLRKASAGAFGHLPLVGGMAEEALDRVANEASKATTTLAAQMDKKHKTGMNEQHKQARRDRQNPLERAVGFGEQESALASINRSLRSTERSLKDLSARISAKDGKPPAPSDQDPMTSKGGF